ncbi:MAG: kynureninase [Acetobacteraceae bacterium]|nr:kynureninase [Acetobacteraceae bacterium]
MPITRDDLEQQDAADPLAGLRDGFVLPPGVVYLDGNSLGPLPRATAPRVAEVVAAEWGQGLIRSWNDAGWIDLARRVADKIARVIGAPVGSVGVGDSTTVNLFKLLGAALSLRPGRRTILSQTGNFPTDLYVAQGIAALLGRGHVLRTAERDALADAIGADTAVVMLTHVDFRSSAMFDMRAITAAAQAAGAAVIWDLAHSAGAVPLDLAGCGAEFAVGCGYKFLNGGPGAPSFLYIRPDLVDRVSLPLQGWLGHADPFAFEPDFRPAPGMARTVVGTPPILSLAALEIGVDSIGQVDPGALRAKSIGLSTALIALVAQECGAALRLASPRDPAQRGSQVSFAHEHAYALTQALIARGVIGDFRAPDLLRFGITPLYLRYVDLWTAVAALREVLAAEAWRAPEFANRRAVT